MLKFCFLLVFCGTALFCGASAETGTLPTGTFRLSESGRKSAGFMADAGMFFHYMKKNDRNKAAEKLQSALDRNPGFIPFAMFAVEFYRDGTLPEEKFVNLAKRHPESAMLCGIVADALAMQGKLQEAEDLLDFAVAYRLEPGENGEPPAGMEKELDQESLQVMFSSYLAHLARRKKFEKADRFLEKADRICRMELSENALLSRIEYFLTAKRENPGNPAYREAFRKYADQLRRKLDGPNRFCTEVPISLVSLLAGEKETDLLEALLGEAILTDPSSLEAYRNLGVLYTLRQEPGNVLRALTCEILLTKAKNRKLPPGKLTVLLYHTIYSGNEKNVRAQVNLLAGMKMMNDDLYFRAADFFIERGKYHQARVYAVRISSEQVRDTLFALILQREKKYRQALQLYLKLERENPDFPGYKMSVAEMASKTGDVETEEQFVNEMILKADKWPEFRNYLGYTWADKGIKLDRAENYIRSALKDDPQNYAYLDSLAWVLYRKKSFVEAKKAILEALEKCPEKSSRGVLLDHAGDIFSALGEMDAARDFWQKAVQTGDPELEKEIILKKISPDDPGKEPESAAEPESTSDQNPESAADDPKNSPAEP